MVIIYLSVIFFLSELVYALPISSCTPSHCPEGYYEDAPTCSNGKCYVTCSYFTGCSTNYSVVYNTSEYLPDLNIPSFSGAWRKEFQIGNFTPNDINKCYKFKQTTPNNFISSSRITNYEFLNLFDSGISLYWTDNSKSIWYNNQKYYSTGENSNFIWSSDAGGVWVDSCGDPGDNFDSADSFIYTNNLYCAPNQQACNNFNSTYCDTGCYYKPTELDLVLESDNLKNNLVCNNFGDFDNTGSGIGGDIDYVNFASQTVYMYVEAYDAVANNSFTNTCDYWPQCSPSDPCCDLNGYFRLNGYVCKSAHNSVCSSFNSTSCDGYAYEDRCTGTSSSCPNNNYQIDYDDACNEIECVGQSCSGSTFQPARQCNKGTCQLNQAYNCPNNLNCLDSTSCKKNANSVSDCRANYTFDTQYSICREENIGNSNGLFYDNNGNLISGFGLNYTYNDFNQILKVITINGTSVADYLYDDSGSRIKKVLYGGNSNTTIYYIDENFIQIVNSSGVYNETYYYDEENLVAKKDYNENKFYYHPDHLGSTSLVTDESGNEVEVVTYAPFGESLTTNNERFLYTGKEKDSETGLYYYGARYYDPSIGHFIQPDTEITNLYNSQDLNRYSYVRNNPYKYVDPSGNVPIIPLVIAAVYFTWKVSNAYITLSSVAYDIKQGDISGGTDYSLKQSAYGFSDAAIGLVPLVGEFFVDFPQTRQALSIGIGRYITDREKRFSFSQSLVEQWPDSLISLMDNQGGTEQIGDFSSYNPLKPNRGISLQSKNYNQVLTKYHQNIQSSASRQRSHSNRVLDGYDYYLISRSPCPSCTYHYLRENYRRKK